MKKIISLILAILMLSFMSGCGEKKPSVATSEDANEFLTEFFSSYVDMNEYLKSPEIAISAFALHGEGLSGIIRATYQAESITFAFKKPVKVSENVFSADVTVIAPDIKPLYDMYAIDRMLTEEPVPDDFVAQTFYNNICAGTTNTVTSSATVTVRYNGESKKWSVDPSNELAFAMFPNIDKAN